MTGAGIRDALGRPVPLDPEPQRIVALVPSVTRCLFDLGMGDRVAGRTDYCLEPPAATKTLPRIGGPKTVAVDRVLDLKPDLVLADAEENQKEQVQELVGRGTRVYVAMPRNLELVAEFLRDLAALVRRPLAIQWAKELVQVARKPVSPAVRFACLVWKAPYIVAAPDTLPHALLTAAGGTNVISTHPERRYPETTVHQLAVAEPRVILLPDDPYPFSSADVIELEQAVPGATALRIPGQWVSWYGSRMVEALEGLRLRLAPYR